MPQTNPTYTIPNSPDLTASLAENDRLQKAIEEKRSSKGNLWDVIQFKLKVDWTGLTILTPLKVAL